MRQLILIISLLGAAGGLFGQDSTVVAEKLGRWSVGLQTGFGLRETGYYRNYSGSTQTLTFDVLAEYRAAKWFSLILKTGWLQHSQNSPLRVISNQPSGPSYLVNDLKVRNVLSVGMSARVNIRLWQGDLYFGLGFDLGMGSLNRRIRTANQSEDVFYYYRTSLITFETYNVGYTYWPMPRFGVSLQYSKTSSWLISNSNPTYIPLHRVRTVSNSPFYDEDVTTTKFREPFQAIIHLGIHFRL
ncbi:MAG: hypothetical protein WBA17_12655 [Saprospiraceae bacterium]